MPDFFDRLIARGTQRPAPGQHAPGQPGGRAGRAGRVGGPSDEGPVAFALPRLPGPFERPSAEPPGGFIEAVDEVWEAHPGTARTRLPLGTLAGTGTGTATPAAITPPPLLRDAATPLAQGRAAAVSAEQPPKTPAQRQQAQQLPRATPVPIAADAGAAALDHASSQPAADRQRDARATTGPPERTIAQPSPPRMLAVPVSAVRAARPAADEARTGQAPPPAPPPLVVRIGRIEVRNTSPDRRERQPKRRTSRTGPKRTLAEYLAGASTVPNGGGNPWGGAR